MIGSISIDRYFKISSYLLMAVGFITLIFTGSVDIPSVFLYTLALILSWYSDKKGSKLQIQPRTANMLALSFIPFIYIDFRFISNSFTGPLIHYSLFISIFNLFKVKADRDWVFLYLITIFQVLLAATLTIDITFIVMLSIFVICALATLEAFEIRRSRSEVFEPKDVRLSNRAGRALPIRRIGYLISMTFVMVLLIGFITAPIFLLIPRVNSGFMAQSFGSSMVSLTGFSDIVELGEVGNIKKNSQVIMHVRVKLADGTPARVAPKWRGVTLSQYDGRSWREPRRDQRRVLRPVDGQYKIGQPDPNNAQVVEQVFYIEPISTPVVFIANRPISVSSQLPTLARMQSESLITQDHSYKQITYTAYSDISLPAYQQLENDAQDYSDEIKDRYLQLPDMDKKVADLAKEITKDSKSRYDKAHAIENYLRTKFGYTLDLKRTNEPDPLVDFLFNVKAGHCEYFASSMVVMLRSLGIAARMVNGFQPGEFNEVGNVFTVRQSDAHSWVEVYFPGTDRWIEFDPTPPDGQSQYSNDIASRVRKYFDAMRMIWIDYVVTYDSQRQSYLAASIQQTIVRYKIQLDSYQMMFKQSMLRWYASLSNGQSVRNNFGSLIFIGLIISLLLATWQARRLLTNWQLSPSKIFNSKFGRIFLLPWLRWRTRSNPQQSAVLFYNEMLSALSRWGVEKPGSQTPLEFAREVDIPGVKLITNYYNTVRFRGTKLSDDDLQQVRKHIGELSRKSPVKKVIKPFPWRRVLLAGSTVIVLFIGGGFGLLYYFQTRFDRSASIAQMQIKHYVSPKFTEQELLNTTIAETRTISGDGGTDLAKVLLHGVQVSATQFGDRLPWDEKFDPVLLPDRARLEPLFTDPMIETLENAAAKQQFSLSENKELDASGRAMVSYIEQRALVDKTDLLLWKAYIYLRDNRAQDCIREISLLVSLGEHLKGDYTFANNAVGYIVSARGAWALSKYYRLSGDIAQARKWSRIARENYSQRAQLINVFNQIHTIASSDTHFEALSKLANSNDHALAKESINAVGTAWINNPKHIILGMPSERHKFLEELTHSSDPVLAKTAENVLGYSSRMDLLQRLEAFRYSIMP